MISIIVPIFNAAEYLTDCIDSLLGQTTMEPLQIILIDDSSTDNSLTIAQSYAKKHAEDPLRQVILLMQPHSGQSTARNLGLQRAEGEYIAFVDSDDRIAPDWCDRHLAAIKGVDYVQSGHRRTSDALTEDGWHVGIRRLPKHKFNYTSPCMRLYRRNALRDIRFEGGMIYEDVIFSTDLWLSGATCRIIDYAGYLYTKNPESTTAVPHPDAQKRVFTELKNRIPNVSWKGKLILLYTIFRLKIHFILEIRKQMDRDFVAPKRETAMLLAFLFMTCFSLFAFAGDAQYQDVYYSLDENHLTAEVTLNPKASGELFLPEQITVGQNQYTVVAIGDKAFKGCKNLKAIVLPKSLQRVYRSAFEGTGIMLNKSNWKDGCLWVDSILIATDKTIKSRYTIPEGTRLIAAGAFAGNKTIERVDLPACIARIDHETFRDCKNLQKITIPATITSIGEEAFTGSGIAANENKWKKGALIIDDCIVATNDELPAKYVFKNKTPIRLIAERAFANRKGLKSVTIPETITSIPTAAFYGCEGLTDVIIPASVKEVGNFAFYNCTLLKTATLPADLERLGAGVFYGCINLKEQVLSDKLEVLERAVFFMCRGIKHITLPAHLRRLDDGAFAGCATLEEIELPQTLTYLGEQAFAGCAVLRKVVIPDGIAALNKQVFQGCTRLYRLDLPDGLYAIGDEALDGCLALERINIPTSTFRIGVRAFHNCQQLRNIYLVDHIHMIEEGAFMECKMLEEIQLPASLQRLQRAAFAQCINLQKVQLNPSLKEIEDGAFCQCRSLREVQWNDSLKTIGTEAFLDCRYLRTPLFPPQVTVGKNAFKGCR